MNDRFTCCPIEKLLTWILAEEKQGQIFGIRKSLFFVPAPGDPFKISRCGRSLETPIGVAAGPHTQLSQNIISAWFTGARYIELKTVQTLDELEITRPCIDMTDEGYNCEWSQELKLSQSFNEYLNAWIILHILKDKLGWGEPNIPGFIFNMSVGYNMEGILNENVQEFLRRMDNCAEEKTAKIDALANIYPRVKDLNIPDMISDNITLSTMHGCPPDEVEKIGRYLLEDRRLNTTIKMNPTLLGPERLRAILNDQLGFEVDVPDEAFGHDLTFDAGLSVIQSLQKCADKVGVEFDLKLSNTLETTNREQNLPDKESMVYMSGRALHPITIHLARRLQEVFEGNLDISFSAGTDCFNIADTLACNLRPVTVCSDVLKPGGYGRLSQYLDDLRETFKEVNASSISSFVQAKSGIKDLKQAALKNLKTYSTAVVSNDYYHKSRFPYDNIKTPMELTSFDCVKAPCVVTCPANQDVPRYMYHTARGEYEKAFQVILETNPFPNVQGMVCDHLCQLKCTRMNYDNPLLIREIKRFIARKNAHSRGAKSPEATGLKVAVIGAGPSGLACAYFLALAGFKVDVFESKDMAGGMAADAIPIFRLDDDSRKRDIDGITALGVRIHYGEKIESKKFETLRETFDYIYIAVGAQKGMELGIPGEDAMGVLDQLSFLSAVRKGQLPDLGKKVVVVGGGNSAMDTARTAKRLVDKDGEVTIIYRRTRREMPADEEEVQQTLDEGAKLVELTAPECLLVEDGKVKSNVCFKMALGDTDKSGRPRPIRIEGSEFEIEADSVISAIGQSVEIDFFTESELRIDPETFETPFDNVFAGGDAVRGASTLIRAIADGKRVAETIRQKAMKDFQLEAPQVIRDVDIENLQYKQARRRFGIPAPQRPFDQRHGFDLVTETLDEVSARKEAERCLQCDVLCNICTTVCPNRANIYYTVEPMAFTIQKVKRSDNGIQIEDVETVKISQYYQIINIGDFCNECGNCTTFCPTDGAPYQVKPTFYLSETAFGQEDNGYYLKGYALKAKVEGNLETLTRQDEEFFYETETLKATFDPEHFTLKKAAFLTDDLESVELRHAAKMCYLMKSLKGFYLFD